MNLRRVLAVAALAVTSLAAGALALDRLFPPDLSRYHARSSETVDANGRLLRAFTTADGKWRLKTTVDDVDPVYLALLKAYEDRRFDDHWGIDPLAAARAAGQWMARGRIVSGASTISMQAARLLEPRRRGLLTKAIQSARALQLEWRYSKREVLAIYLTLAPMGGNLEGVRAASFAYFGKEPKQLSAAEAALLVAIPQSPERRRPERAGKSAQAARDRVLVRGLEHGIIDRVLFDKAASRPVPDRRLAMPMQAPRGWPASRPARSFPRRCASNCRARSASSWPRNAASSPTGRRSLWSRSTIAPVPSSPGWAARTFSAAPARSIWCAPAAHRARR